MNNQHMELVAQFFKNAFFLMLVMRIAVIVVLVVFIFKAMKTPFLMELFNKKSNGISKRSFPGEKSTI
jgi:hypothetical protein